MVYGDICTSKNMGSQASVTTVEQSYPGYMYFLFRNAVKKKGTNASFAELATQMNEQSKSVRYTRPELSLT